MLENEKVKPIEWRPRWSGGAPKPMVFSDGKKTYLSYRVADWDKESISEIKMLEHSPMTDAILALVEFSGGTFRFGIANDEVFSGLPLYNQGIEWAQIIENSRWIAEIKQIHKVHPYYNESHWNDLNHYLLTFKDQILEVVATGYTIEIFQTTTSNLGQEIMRRMNG